MRGGLLLTSASVPPRIMRVSVEKVGRNLHRETHCDNGKTDTLWIYNGWVIYQPLDFASDQAMALPVDHHNSPVQGGIGPDFPDLKWVRPEVFVKTLNYRGQRCDYYEDKDAPPLPGGDSTGSNTAKGNRAWIDAKTKLPVAVEDDATLKTYHFAKEAPVTLELRGVFATVYSRALHTDVTSETPSSTP